jgi:predicted DNA binding protein
MWVAEFKAWHKGSPLLILSEKYDVHAFSQYLNSFEEKGKPKIMRMATFWGKDREHAIEELLRYPGIEVLYREGDRLVFSQNAISSYHTLVTDKTVFFLGPVLEEKGFQWWRVGSNSKENLMQFYRRIQNRKENAKIELLSIHKKQIHHIPLTLIPELKSTDLEWWKTAVTKGYYEYPRKVSLEELSRQMGIPYTTLKDHLRKTEGVLMRRLAQEL